jgi:hypothetical protein
MNDHDSPRGETLLAGYAAMAGFLTGCGLKISKSTLSKLGAPSVNKALPTAERLPIRGYWGNLPIAKPTDLFEWARRRLRPSRGEPSASDPAASAQTVPPRH